MKKQKQGPGGSSTDSVNNGDHKLDFKSIMKDIEYLGENSSLFSFLAVNNGILQRPEFLVATKYGDVEQKSLDFEYQKRHGPVEVCILGYSIPFKFMPNRINQFASGSTHMTWKEKKELENKKVVSLGGKPPKRQRLPLSVARVVMKKQKEREAKMEQENLILGRFDRSHGRDGKKTDRRKPEDRVLKSTGGHFRNGVLDVKNLLRPSTSRANDSDRMRLSDKKKTKKKKGSKKNHGKKNGRGMRR